MKIISPQKKRLLRFTAIAAGIIILLVVILLALGLIYGDKAKELIVNEINSNLLVPVEVGQVEFTIFRSFPDASVVFRNVRMKTSPNLKDAPGLVHAKTISLRFGIFSLITGNYKIRSLVIDEASFTIWEGLNGQDNYHIWKQSGSAGESDVNFDMQRVHLRNTSIYYLNLNKKTDLAFGLPDFSIKGKHKEKRYYLQLAGNLAIKRLLLGDYNYTPASLLGIRGELILNEELKRCEITDAKIMFAGILAGVRGTIGYGRDKNPVQISLTTSGADISDVLMALPATLSDPYKDYKPGGKLTLDAAISGNWGKTSSPQINASFSLSKGTFTHHESGSKISSISLNGKFISKSQWKSEELELTDFKGETKSGKFSGRLHLNNFSTPVLNLKLSANLNLKELEGFIADESLNDLDGKLIADINYQGALMAREKMAVSANGLISLVDTRFRDEKSAVAVNDINGQFELNNGRIFVDGLSFTIGESDVKLSGSFDNLPGYLFYDDQPLHFDAQLNSAKFRLEDILPLSGASSDSTGSNSIFPSGLSFQAGFSIGSFSYKKFTASNAKGNLSLDDNVLRATNLNFGAADGAVTATGLINGRYGDHAQVVCNAELKNVDIARLFYEFDDFGQSDLQSRHISGRGDASVQYTSSLNPDFETEASTVTAVADIEIRNGELLKFEPLMELSDFLDEETLKNVKFSTLRNRIEIAGEKVIIPEMEVMSSAMDLKGYGSHTFKNDIDYHFSLYTSALRKNKRRKNPPPPTAIEDDGLGRPRLFLHMTGTVDEPVISYDRKAVANKIANDFREEKQELRNVIKREFSKNKPLNEEKKAKPVQFEIEWDEDK